MRKNTVAAITIFGTLIAAILSALFSGVGGRWGLALGLALSAAYMISLFVPGKNGEFFRSITAATLATYIAANIAYIIGIFEYFKFELAIMVYLLTVAAIAVPLWYVLKKVKI